jgi:hypothetical protein
MHSQTKGFGSCHCHHDNRSWRSRLLFVNPVGRNLHRSSIPNRSIIQAVKSTFVAEVCVYVCMYLDLLINLGCDFVSLSVRNNIHTGQGGQPSWPRWRQYHGVRREAEETAKSSTDVFDLRPDVCTWYLLNTNQERQPLNSGVRQMSRFNARLVTVGSMVDRMEPVKINVRVLCLPHPTTTQPMLRVHPSEPQSSGGVSVLDGHSAGLRLKKLTSR